MVVTRGNRLDKNRILKMENYCFKRVKSFIYLGVEMNCHNNCCEEMWLRIKGGNSCYFALQKTFRFKLLSKT